MRRFLTLLTLVSLLLELAFGGALAFGQEAGVVSRPMEKERPSEVLKPFVTELPPSAVIGSTAERRAAYESLTTEQRDEIDSRFWQQMSWALERAKPDMRRDGMLLPARIGGVGENPQRAIPVSASSDAPVSFERGNEKPAAVSMSSEDRDADGLPDDFENQVADGFTPFYYVSGGERPGTGFATFQDRVPQMVDQVFGPVPPISYFRVQPLGFAFIGEVQHGFLRVDYLTLWNRDDGLSIGAVCFFNAVFSAGLIGLGVAAALAALDDGHDLDNERSAALVAAPTPEPNSFNTDFMAYRAYDFYTAAHEGTFFDASRFSAPPSPIPPGNHIVLGLSRSKHATYTFNSDGYPLFPGWLIAAVYAEINFLFVTDQIDFLTYLLYLYRADTAFYSCVVERFQDQGGTFSGTRINVGEPNNPMSGSGFIQDPRLRSKLDTPVWVIS